MGARRWLLVSLVALFAGADPAIAAPERVVVASDGDVTLTAWDQRRDLCIAFGKRRDHTESCAADGQGVVTLGSPSRPPPSFYLGAAVPAGATSVEVRRAGELLASGPTVAGEAYRGRRAGSVRFVLVRLPDRSKDDGLRVRALDAAGAPVAVFAPGDSELVTDRRVLLSGRSGRVRWTVVNHRRSSLSSTLFDLDHETVRRCLSVTVVSPGGSSSSEGSCTGGTPDEEAVASIVANTVFAAGAWTDEVCDRRFRLLRGVVDGKSVTVTVLLGDGRRLQARSAVFEEAGKTAYAVAVPAGAAIRGLRVRRPGAAARKLAFSAPPLAVSCALEAENLDEGYGFDPTFSLTEFAESLPPVAPTGPVAEVPGAPAFRIADGPADTLCLALSGRPFTGMTCGLVRPGYSPRVGAVDDFLRPRNYVIAVRAQVARIRFGPKGGPLRELPTVAGEGYTGRYAGLVRFFAASIAGFPELQRTELLDAAGRVLHSETNDISESDLAEPRVFAPRRIAGARGRPSLWQTRVRGAGETARCLALTRGGPPTDRTRCRTVRSGSATVILAAPCTTHRLTVAVAARAGSRVIVRSGAGAPRALPLRAGAGVLTLAPADGLRSLTITGRGKPALRVALRAPAAADQCGWEATFGAEEDRGIRDVLTTTPSVSQAGGSAPR